MATSSWAAGLQKFLSNTAPWDVPLPKQEAQGLVDCWPLSFAHIQEWLGTDLNDQPKAFRKRGLEEHEITDAQSALAVLTEFWRILEALRVSGASHACVHITSVPMLPTDYTWSVVLHGVDPQRSKHVTGHWERFKQRSQALLSGKETTLNCSFELACPQSWLGMGTRWLEKKGGVDMGQRLVDHPSTVLLTVPASWEVSDMVRLWFGEGYHAQWLQARLKEEWGETKPLLSRRPRM